MEKNNLKMEDKNYKFIHGMNNNLSTLSLFLSLCHSVNGDEIFKECLKNAEESLRGIEKMVAEMGLE
jgi:hypothetical protein